MATRLTPPGKDLVRRKPRPVKGVRKSKYPWEDVRRDYCEGIQRDPDNDPLDIQWPTLEEVARKYNIPPTTVFARSSRERWANQKKSIVLQTNIRRRRDREKKLAKEGIQFDTNVLAMSKLGINIVLKRLVEISKSSQQREGMAELMMAAAERGEVIDLSSMGGMADFDAKELEQLSNAAAKFEELGRRILGDPAATSEVPDVVEEASISEQMTNAGEERLTALLEVMENTGILDHMMSGMVRNEIEAGDDVIEAEIIEDEPDPNHIVIRPQDTWGVA